MGLFFPPEHSSTNYCFKMMATDSKEPTQSVQTFGRKKTATAVAYCKRGQGVIRVNGKPLEQVEPKPLQFKLQEPLLLLGKDRFSEVDIKDLLVQHDRTLLVADPRRCESKK